MITQLYKVNGWIINSDNKPSLESWNWLKENGYISIFETEPKTITQPSLSQIEIQIATPTLDNAFKDYNLIKFQDYFYKIVDVSVVQQQANQFIFQIKGQIDYYLSFLLPIFSEKSTNKTPVFFNQKTAPQYFLQEDGTNLGVNYQGAYWLRNKPTQLANIGKLLQKNTYTFNNYDYFAPNGVSISNFNFSSLNNGINFWPYLIVNINQQQVANSNALQAYGFVPIGYGGEPQTAEELPWFLLNNNNNQIANNYYIDVIYLPAPLQQSIGNIGNQSAIQKTTLANYNVGMANDSGAANNYPNLSVFYTYGGFGANWIHNNNKPFSNAFSILENNLGVVYFYEPAILNYFKFRIHSGGEDSFIDLTSFNYNFQNQYSQGLLSPTFQYLLSFQIGLTIPDMLLTNIPFINYMNGDFIQPQPNQGILWGYSNAIDSIFTLTLKSYGSSASNSWSNYMANHRNSYHMGLNISHMAVQQSQANLAKDVSTETANAMNLTSAIFNPASYANNLAQGASDIAIGTFQEETQNDKYQYQKTGLKEDMSRVSNIRMSNNSGSCNLNSYGLAWILETLVNYELEAAINYFALNGYVIDRWAPFLFWNTRNYFNYLKITYLSDSIFPNLNVFYKKGIDKLLNQGIRIFNTAYFKSFNQYEGVIDYSILMNTNYPNYAPQINNVILNPQQQGAFVEYLYLAGY